MSSFFGIFMKRAAAKNTVEILRKVESIEKKMKDLKLTLLKSITPSTKKPITVKGILKGVEVTEEDISFGTPALPFHRRSRQEQRRIDYGAAILVTPPFDSRKS